MRKIKLFPAPHLELRVSVSDEMVKDFRECRSMAKREGLDGKDCDTCSWKEVEFESTGMCELLEMEQLLGDKADEMQGL